MIYCYLIISSSLFITIVITYMPYYYCRGISLFAACIYRLPTAFAEAQVAQMRSESEALHSKVDRLLREKEDHVPAPWGSGASAREDPGWALRPKDGGSLDPNNLI